MQNGSVGDFDQLLETAIRGLDRGLDARSTVLLVQHVQSIDGTARGRSGRVAKFHWVLVRLEHAQRSALHGLGRQFGGHHLVWVHSGVELQHQNGSDAHLFEIPRPVNLSTWFTWIK